MIKLDKINKKRIGAYTLAGFIAATPIIGNASSPVVEDEQEYSYDELVHQNIRTDQEIINASMQDEKASQDIFDMISMDDEDYFMTCEDFCKGVVNAWKYVTGFMKYDNTKVMKEFFQQLVCFYFNFNRDYIDVDLERELINGVNYNYEGKNIKIQIFETDMSKLSDMSGIQNFMNANNFLNLRADYNQSHVRHTKNIEELIDLSEFCYNESDKEIIHNMFVNWFESHKNNIYDMDTFEELFKSLTTLNAYENKYNAANLSVGARWGAQMAIGNDAMQVLRDYFLEFYKMSELTKYFKADLLNKGQFFLRDDAIFETDLFNEVHCPIDSPEYREFVLAEKVFEFGQLWKFCLTDVNNDIFKSFEGHCKTLTR